MIFLPLLVVQVKLEQEAGGKILGQNCIETHCVSFLTRMLRGRRERVSSMPVTMRPKTLTLAELRESYPQGQSPLTFPRICSYTSHLQKQLYKWALILNCKLPSQHLHILRTDENTNIPVPCQKTKFFDSAWQAETGGWWLTWRCRWE